MISEIFSRIIDDALWKEIDSQKEIISSDTSTDEEKSQASVRLNAISDPVKGRQLIVQEMGIPVIIDEIKEELERDLRFAREYGADDVKVQLWQNTIDFFEELFKLVVKALINESNKRVDRGRVEQIGGGRRKLSRVLRLVADIVQSANHPPRRRVVDFDRLALFVFVLVDKDPIVLNAVARFALGSVGVENNADKSTRRVLGILGDDLSRRRPGRIHSFVVEDNEHPAPPRFF